MCHCPGGVAFRAATPGATGACQKPRNAVKNSPIFVTYFFNDSKQTYGYRRVHKVLERGWCYNQSRDGAPAHAAGGPGGGVSPAPRPTTTVPAADPARSPRPDRKELHSRCSSSGNWWVTSPIFTPGKDSCTRQAATRPLCLKRIVGYATAGKHANRIGPKRSAKLAARNCQPIKDVTIFHVESRGRSTRPLTTPPP